MNGECPYCGQDAPAFEELPKRAREAYTWLSENASEENTVPRKAAAHALAQRLRLHKETLDVAVFHLLQGAGYITTVEPPDGPPFIFVNEASTAQQDTGRNQC